MVTLGDGESESDSELDKSRLTPRASSRRASLCLALAARFAVRRRSRSLRRRVRARSGDVSASVLDGGGCSDSRAPLGVGWCEVWHTRLTMSVITTDAIDMESSASEPRVLPEERTASRNDNAIGPREPGSGSDVSIRTTGRVPGSREPGTSRATLLDPGRSRVAPRGLGEREGGSGDGAEGGPQAGHSAWPGLPGGPLRPL